MKLVYNLCRSGIGSIAVANWILGSVLLIHVIWTLNTANNFHLITSGKSLIIASQLAFGLLISIKGLLGIFGICGRQDWLLKAFMFLTVLTISIEVGTFISLKVANVRVSDFVEQGWTETNKNTKNYIQRNFQCCGYTGLSEFASKLDPIDDSCYKPTINSEQLREPYRVGCRDKMIDWANKQKKKVVVLTIVLLVIQVLSVVMVLISFRHRPSSSSHQLFKQEMLLQSR